MKHLPIQIGPLQLDVALDALCLDHLMAKLEGFERANERTKARRLVLRCGEPSKLVGPGLLIREHTFALLHQEEETIVYYTEWKEGESEIPAQVGFLHALSLIAIESGLLLVHASAVRSGPVAWVFMGPSGAGKSTLASWFPHADVINDDFILLDAEEPPRVHSQPLFGKTMWDRRGQALSSPVYRLFTLRHGNETGLRNLPESECFLRLMACAGVPETATEHRAKAFVIAHSISAAVQSAELLFPYDREETLGFLDSLLPSE